MRLHLINPRNTLIYATHYKQNCFNKYRVWKPLGLLVVARVTPADWEVKIIDENLGVPADTSGVLPDLVGLTAFSSQATRAYELAAEFRARGVPVVMGGIHATMRLSEALEYVDAVVTGEAEEIWPSVLDDARKGVLGRLYRGHLVESPKIAPARHDLMPNGYAFGSIQTTRGCPLNCDFCSVPAFNGRGYRLRPIDDVINEFRRDIKRHLPACNLLLTSNFHPVLNRYLHPVL